jgi:hypothetical protein
MGKADAKQGELKTEAPNRSLNRTNLNWRIPVLATCRGVTLLLSPSGP